MEENIKREQNKVEYLIDMIKDMDITNKIIVCFQLTKYEMNKMWFQKGTTLKGENNKYKNEKYLPYAYTEQGIAMI